MISITIKPESPKTAEKEIKDINKAASVCTGDVDAISGKYMVDAKSVLGLFSLDFHHGIDIVFHEDSDKELFEAKLASLK